MTASKVAICDMGTGFIKAGFAGDKLPRHVFPSYVGRPLLRADESFGGASIPDLLVGDDCQPYLPLLDVKYPLENGVVRNWEDMTHLFDYLFDKKLHIKPEETRFLLTEAANTPKPAKTKMLEVMFEHYQMHSVQIIIQALLVLFSEGLTTGVVVDSGDGVTHIMPVYEGVLLEHLVKRLDIAGRDLTRHLMKLLQRQGYSLNKTSDFDTVRRIKETFCYTSVHPEIDASLAESTTVLMREYTLPDGQKVKISRERFEAVEPLFNPSLIGKEVGGVSDQLFELIHTSPLDVRPTFYNSIYVSGGSTMFPGFPDRLEADLKKIYKSTVLRGVEVAEDKQKVKIQVNRNPQRMHHVFSGASLLGEISAQRDAFWVHKSEWEEQGPHRCVERLGRLIG
ncbi:hypothetical protein RCL1_008532 [Eukaryota sp. TZLM3-RCL]